MIKAVISKLETVNGQYFLIIQAFQRCCVREITIYIFYFPNLILCRTASKIPHDTHFQLNEQYNFL